MEIGDREVETMSTSAELSLVRSNDYFGVFRGTVVYVDGTRTAVVRMGKGMTLQVPAGTHRIAARMDWIRSEGLSVDLPPSEKTTIRIALPFWRCALATITFGIVRSIRLETLPA